MSPHPSISVNLRASELVTGLIADAAELGLSIAKGASGETVIDAGSKAEGGIEAGLRIARICLGGLAEVRLLPSQAMPRWPWTIGGAFFAARHRLPREPICRLAPRARQGQGCVFRPRFRTRPRAGTR